MKTIGGITLAVFLPLAAALLLWVSVCAEITYVITDGSRVLVHTTTATNPETVLGEAGLQLGSGDTFVATETGRIEVCRGKTVTVDYHGERIEVVSPGESVEELLGRLELSVGAEDWVSVPLGTEVCDGMVVRIGKEVRQREIYTMALPHETIRCSDGSLPEGTEKVITPGTDGQVLVEAAVTYVGGVETGRKILGRQVVTQPAREIIAVGTAAPAPEKTGPVIGSSTITLPTGEVLTYTEKVSCLATAYTCEGYVGTTATGTRARVGAIAVDPEVFPYGTRFFILTKDGEYIYGIATAEDCGSKKYIYGTRLDLYFDTKKECVQFGARSCDVYILG